MHVRKSVLIAGTAIILLLTAALAYMAGKSAQVSTVVDHQVQPTEPNQIVAQPEPSTLPTIVTPSAGAPTAILPARKSQPGSNRSTAFTLAEQRLIDAWFETEEMCRGSSDVESVEMWCRRREVATRNMNQAGICFGRDSDQSAAEYDIHLCGPGSFR